MRFYADLVGKFRGVVLQGGSGNEIGRVLG